MNLSQNELLTQLRQMDEYEFEELVADVWEQRGWETTVTTGSNDRGIDVIAVKSNPFNQKHLIQAKRYSAGQKIGSPDIQQYDSLRRQGSDVDAVVIVTTSSFSSPAKQTANDLNVKLINGTELSRIILDNNPESVLPNYTVINNKRASSGNANTELRSKSESADSGIKNSAYPNERVGDERSKSFWSDILPNWAPSIKKSESIFGQCPDCRTSSLTRDNRLWFFIASYKCENCGAELKESPRQQLINLSIQNHYTLIEGDSEFVGETKKFTEWRTLFSNQSEDGEPENNKASDS